MCSGIIEHPLPHFVCVFEVQAIRPTALSTSRNLDCARTLRARESDYENLPGSKIFLWSPAADSPQGIVKAE